MAASGYGFSHPNDRSSSVAAALIAYGQQGGALYAAYRLPDNPLAPSHLRWQGDNGEAMEAQHNPNEAYELTREEREAWAQIALASAMTQPDAVGTNAPWLPVRMERERAFDLGVRAQRAWLASHPSYGAHSTQSGPHASGSPSGYGAAAPNSATPSAYLPQQPGAGFQQYQRPQTPNPHSDDYPPTRLIDALPASSPSRPDLAQSTGQWARNDLLRGMAYPGAPQQEITVIPCIEVEMPTLLSAEQQDFTRDFARDVAVHFGRAAHSISQARELRGWMRGARIVLAVRMSFGPGSRPANRAEMEHGAALLSEALARRTLPYAQLRFADYAEWDQGVELPS